LVRHQTTSAHLGIRWIGWRSGMGFRKL